MTNFSSFFPAAGGGGGFTKMNKYSTSRALDDATHKLKPDVSGRVGVAISGGGQTSFQWYADIPSGASTAEPQNALVGFTFDIGYGTQTVTANAGAVFNTNQLVSFTPAVAGNVSANSVCDLVAPTNFTVNPANDLGLSDGDSIGYMLVGSGGQIDGAGGKGGKVLQGTAIISNASTNLILTIGSGNQVASTITGGLTLTSANGFNEAGAPDHGNKSALSGIIGYGMGGGKDNSDLRPKGSSGHGWGVGSYDSTNSPGDGAILIFH